VQSDEFLGPIAEEPFQTGVDERDDPFAVLDQDSLGQAGDDVLVEVFELGQLGLDSPAAVLLADDPEGESQVASDFPEKPAVVFAKPGVSLMSGDAQEAEFFPAIAEGEAARPGPASRGREGTAPTSDRNTFLRIAAERRPPLNPSSVPGAGKRPALFVVQEKADLPESPPRLEATAGRVEQSSGVRFPADEGMDVSANAEKPAQMKDLGCGGSLVDRTSSFSISYRNAAA